MWVCGFVRITNKGGLMRGRRGGKRWRGHLHPPPCSLPIGTYKVTEICGLRPPPTVLGSQIQRQQGPGPVRISCCIHSLFLFLLHGRGVKHARS